MLSLGLNELNVPHTEIDLQFMQIKENDFTLLDKIKYSMHNLQYRLLHKFWVQHSANPVEWDMDHTLI